MIGAAGDGLAAVRAELVVRVEDGDEVCDSGVEAPSDTWISKAYDSPTVKVPAATEQTSVAPAAAPLPLADAPHSAAREYDPSSVEMSQSHEYDGVPVVGMLLVTVNVWSTFRSVSLNAGASGAVSAEATETGEDGAEVAVSGVAALSVTLSSKEYWSPGVSEFATTLQLSGEPPFPPVPLSTAHSVAEVYVAASVETSHCQE
jgi:hypothetical protein